MSWWEAALLGLIQGLTEFLPVSSSGHLVLGQYLLGIDPEVAEGTTFEVFVHFGTVLSILTVYRQRVASLVIESLRAVRRPSELKASYLGAEDFRLAIFILITLVPTGIVYLLFREDLEELFGDPRAVSAALIVTGILLLLTLVRKNPSGTLNPIKAFVVGVAQSAAMIPGISRSGATICTALYQNVEPRRAADFSFLMLLPVVLGATLLKLPEVGLSGEDLLPLLIGTVVAYVSGVLAIRLMIDFVSRGSLHYFAYYCFAVGLLGLVFI